MNANIHAYLRCLLAVFLFSTAIAHAQIDPAGVAGIVVPQPNLPADETENADNPRANTLGRNSFGATPTVVPAIHSDRVRVPDLVIPPNIPKRLYVTVRYYGCRPWFRHPYTGATLTKAQLVRSVFSSCPAFPDLPVDQLLLPSPNLPVPGELAPDGQPYNESYLSIEDGGLIDDNAQEEFLDEIDAEHEAAQALGINLGPKPTHILHAPYWGLYCLKIRFCIPYDRLGAVDPAGKAYRFHVHFPYRLHQRWCWSHWWWHWWRAPISNPTGIPRIYPCRPICLPHSFWTRVGPDWIWHVTNANRYRHWCLYGLRFFCVQWGGILQTRPPLPQIGALDLTVDPATILPEFGNAIATPWQRPWPYPIARRYWPYRPYCTRWYWFRPLPWRTYRHFPPIIQCAFAIPKPTAVVDQTTVTVGSGFIPGPEPTPDDPVNPTPDTTFPANPPNLGGDQGLGSGLAVDSFFDVFFDIDAVCTIRPVEQHSGDLNGNGKRDAGDNNRDTRAQALEDFGPDDPALELNL